MKLLYITNGINGAGGLERVLSIKASYLADYYNYEVSILSLNDNHLNPFYPFSDKITILSIPVTGNPLQYIKAYKKGITEIVDQIKPDVISVCDDGLKGFFIPQIIKEEIPIIYERHASVKLNFGTSKNQTILTKIKNKISHFIMQKMAAQFDVFVVLTNGNTKEWSSNNLRIIPNPLSFYPNEKATLSSQKVIAVGSHSFNKGYDLLLDAWKIIAKKYTNWQLHIYGKFDKDETFLHYASKIGVTDSVMFYQPIQSIEKAYLDSSIMVLPSRSEGFGMVLIEAMACGVPVVSFDCPHGPADIITEGEDGYLIEKENVNALAVNLIKLIENQDLRVRMGVKAKQNVKRYLIQEITQQWDSLFKELTK